MKLINIKGKDSIAAVAKVRNEQEDEDGLEDIENTEAPENGMAVDTNNDSDQESQE